MKDWFQWLRMYGLSSCHPVTLVKHLTSQKMIPSIFLMYCLRQIARWQDVIAKMLPIMLITSKVHVVRYVIILSRTKEDTDFLKYCKTLSFWNRIQNRDHRGIQRS